MVGYLLSSRDVFGRKSLLWIRTEDCLILSQSITCFKKTWSEIPSGSISVINFDNYASIWHSVNFYSVREINNCLWVKQFVDLKFTWIKNKASKLLVVNRELGSTDCDIVSEMVERLCNAVRFCCSDLDSNSSLAVLFSGGVDSLLIAVITAFVIPENIIIDLINVSFDEKDYNLAPDRPHAIEAYLYLLSQFGNSRFRLILVNVDGNELVRCRQQHIAYSIAPSLSVLDDSVGCVLWFAARGSGVLYGSNDSTQVKSNAKIVLVGSGADEIFGGYLSHRSAYEKYGRLGVIDELQREMYRIGERNLGRDDRVTSGIGKDARAPFLDDRFVEWLNSLPLEAKADFTKGRGFGEKKLIRKALENFGSPQSLYNAPKRAMQFGARIAKREKRKEKANDICDRILESLNNGSI
ncbi:unnamed protein product [Dracunculus medinensis]|uniref:Asparagine synthetase domain-containing protein n=1 Tax=Dracunculus medinensis TaxID=318479 RepID=A0A0N4UER3_DRAME|nr:unnamed protein product [Dracunculus medinensis]